MIFVEFFILGLMILLVAVCIGNTIADIVHHYGGNRKEQ